MGRVMGRNGRVDISCVLLASSDEANARLNSLQDSHGWIRETYELFEDLESWLIRCSVGIRRRRPFVVGIRDRYNRYIVVCNILQYQEAPDSSE